MFELKYAITESDVRAENKKVSVFYFWLFFAVAAAGLAAGIVAVVLNPKTSVMVLGVIILVMSGLLMAIALLLLIAPKNMVHSAVQSGEEELNVVIDKNGITVNEQNVAPFAAITDIKNRKSYIAAYIGKDKVFIVKNHITSGGEFSELFSYMTERQGRLLLTPPTDAVERQDDTAVDNK
ncbi:MAG: hypothetical protein J1F69_02045 [Clostridiales bacterium]|nr:hypothetical protein [Clostridiales bacterium]